MHINERFDQILDYLKLQKQASVADLSRLFYVSPATVRRDLTEMERLGLVKRTHGGVIYAKGTNEVSFSIRQEANIQEKDRVATIAAPHLLDYRTIFIDNSSTCLALVSRLDLRHKTVVTNGLRIANQLMQQEQVHIILPGGELQANLDFAGSMACEILRRFHFDAMFCSCAAMDLSGSYENSLASREIKAAAMELSDHRFLLVDHTKLHHTGPFRTCSLSRYERVFTDGDDDAVFPFREAGVEVVNR